MRHHSASSKELQEIGAGFAKTLAPSEAATVVALSGELGAGKTTFVQAIARELGIDRVVASPTFVIEKIYTLPHKTSRGFARLVHIDAYRLRFVKELAVLGWGELVQAPGNLILVEWPEKVASLIPPSAIRVRIDIDGDGRIISINDEEKDPR
jgi:tRNA threonylcarbamoyladenosine biosynthesis protein TsaE